MSDLANDSPEANAETQSFNPFELYVDATPSVVQVLSYPPGIRGWVSKYFDQHYPPGIGDWIPKYLDPVKLVDGILKKVGFIRGSNGSGFFVEHGETNKCDILTANHVVGRDKPMVRLHDGQVVAAKIEKRDAKNDIAILRLEEVKDPTETCKGLQLAGDQETIERGELAVMVSSIGDFKLPELTILQVDPLFDSRPSQMRNYTSSPGEDLNREVFVFIGHGQHGDSGSGILNIKGEVVGMAQSASEVSTVATPAHYMREDLDQLNGK